MIGNIITIISWGVRHVKVISLFALGTLIVGGIFAVGASVRHYREALASARAEAYSASLRADSATAASDTTRIIVGVLADSLALVTRRSVQLLQDRDATDRALAQERRVRAGLSVQVVQLEAMAETLAEALGDTLTAEFTIRQPPYTVQAQASLVPPPGVSRLHTQVALDSVHLEVRVGCDTGTGLSIRPARVSVSGPSWARVGLSNVTQAPEVCNTTPGVGQGKRGGGWVRPLVVGLVAGGLVGWGLGK